MSATNERERIRLLGSYANALDAVQLPPDVEALTRRELARLERHDKADDPEHLRACLEDREATIARLGAERDAARADGARDTWKRVHGILALHLRDERGEVIDELTADIIEDDGHEHDMALGAVLRTAIEGLREPERAKGGA